jgi:hypothetical protein
MIPRYQKILFWTLLSVSIVMAIILIRLRERAHDRMVSAADKMPMSAPAATPVTVASLVVANDASSSLDSEDLKIALPEAPGARARLLLEKLLEGYTDPDSVHPIALARSIPNGASSGELVEEVFLMPIDKARPKGNATVTAAANIDAGSEMAVVNLSAAFVAAHPSGIEPELLTLLSIIGTLHANLPQISEVRFLVDGQPRETLAGHADLTRVYLATDSVESRQ